MPTPIGGNGLDTPYKTIRQSISSLYLRSSALKRARSPTEYDKEATSNTQERKLNNEEPSAAATTQEDHSNMPMGSKQTGQSNQASGNIPQVELSCPEKVRSDDQQRDKATVDQNDGDTTNNQPCTSAGPLDEHPTVPACVKETDKIHQTSEMTPSSETPRPRGPWTYEDQMREKSRQNKEVAKKKKLALVDDKAFPETLASGGSLPPAIHTMPDADNLRGRQHDIVTTKAKMKQ
jgi:hypothetical protein